MSVLSGHAISEKVLFAMRIYGFANTASGKHFKQGSAHYFTGRTQTREVAQTAWCAHGKNQHSWIAAWPIRLL